MCFKIYVPRKKTQASTRGDDRGNFFFLLLTPFFSSANVSSNFRRRQFTFDPPSSFFFKRARKCPFWKFNISPTAVIYFYSRNAFFSRFKLAIFIRIEALLCNYVVYACACIRCRVVSKWKGREEKKKCSQTGLKVFFKHRKNSKNAHLPRIVRGRYIIIGIIIVRFQSGCRLLSVAQTHDSEWVNDIKPHRLFVKRDIASFFTRRCLPWLP